MKGIETALGRACTKYPAIEQLDGFVDIDFIVPSQIDQPESSIVRIVQLVPNYSVESTGGRRFTASLNSVSEAGSAQYDTVAVRKRQMLMTFQIM